MLTTGENNLKRYPSPEHHHQPTPANHDWRIQGVADREGKLVVTTRAETGLIHLDFGQCEQCHHWDVDNLSCNCYYCQRIIREAGTRLTHQRLCDSTRNLL